MFGSEPEVVEEFLGEGAVEAFGFAVAPGSVWPGATMFDAAFGEHLCERVGTEVGAVVGENLLNGDAVEPETGEDRGGFVVAGFDVGDAAVVVYGTCRYV